MIMYVLPQCALRYMKCFYNDGVPVPVAINEAIELTKQYDDSLAAFVHGNLGNYCKGLI